MIKSCSKRPIRRRHGQWNFCWRKVQQQQITYRDMSKPARVGKFANKRLSISCAEWFLVNAITFTLPAFLSFSREDFLGTAFKRLSRCMKTLDKALRACVFPPKAVSESLSASVVLLRSPSWLLMFWKSKLDKRTKAMRPKMLLRGVKKKPDATIGAVWHLQKDAAVFFVLLLTE